jgi:hypothetical protein
MLRMRIRRPTEKISPGMAGWAKADGALAEALEVIAKSIVA